jgi:hypothetical protein
MPHMEFRAVRAGSMKIGKVVEIRRHIPQLVD